jgi:hypothetical protein
MTKQDIKERLQVSGHWHRPSTHPLWQTAFDLYMQETQQPVSVTCSKCFDKVKKWLSK